MKISELKQLNEGVAVSFDATAITKQDMIALFQQVGTAAYSVTFGAKTTPAQLKKGVVDVKYSGFEEFPKRQENHVYLADINHDVMEENAGAYKGLLRHKVTVFIRENGKIGVQIYAGVPIK